MNPRIEVNGPVLIFCLAASVLTGILSGLAPALQSSRPDLVDSLKDEAHGSGASAGRKTRGLLVVTEVALSVMLLAGAGLTVRSFLALLRVDLGFRPERVLVAAVPLPPKRYATWEQRNRFARELLERVRNLPGVQAATIGNGGLPFGAGQIDLRPGKIIRIPRRIKSRSALVAESYLRTLGVPLRRGRMLAEQEVDAAQPLALVNEAAAKLWPAGEDPIGRRLRLDELAKPGWLELRIPTNASAYVTVIGVVGDTRNDPRPAESSRSRRCWFPTRSWPRRAAPWPSAPPETPSCSSMPCARRCARWTGNSPWRT